MEQKNEDPAKKEQMRAEYVSRINRVLDYIREHIDEQLTLDVLAGVAQFSRFHFHRIFRAMVGETLNHFIQRVRLERAAAQLLSNPKKPITDIAFDCGFSGSAPFSRAFKETFRVSPSRFRAGEFTPGSKIGKAAGKLDQSTGKKWKDFQVSSYYNYDIKQIVWRIKMKEMKDAQIEVKDMPEMDVAYLRHIGPYKGNAELFQGLFEKLMKWAGARGLVRFPETRVISVYHDDPNITDDEKLRTDVCISVPADTEVDGEIGKMKIPGGKFAVGRFELSSHEYEDAWKAILGAWLPESGFQCDDRLCYELYQNDPKEHPENKCIVDICIPVKPL